MQRVGDYTIVRELGRGGAGAVFLGQSPSGEAVAIKVHAGQLGNPRAEVRFRREVDAMRSLDHAQIVRVRDAGVVGGRPYFVMDYIDGASLGERLRAEGVLEPEEARALVRDVALAIEHAHQRGVLHRDLKPDNVLLDGEGGVWVTDFGLSREVDPRATRLTHTGAFVGTPGFWAPEQALGQREKTGPPADVYGLGAILYACLTGSAPRPSELSMEALSAPITPPDRAQPGVPAWLSRVCMRCLRDEPAERFPSAGALAAALEPPSAATRGALPWVAATLGGLALAAGLGRRSCASVCSSPRPRLPRPRRPRRAGAHGGGRRGGARRRGPGADAARRRAGRRGAGAGGPSHRCRERGPAGGRCRDPRQRRRGSVPAAAALERSLELDSPPGHGVADALPRAAQARPGRGRADRGRALPGARAPDRDRALQPRGDPQQPGAAGAGGARLRGGLGPRPQRPRRAHEPRPGPALLGRTEEALASYDRALALDGTNMIAREGRGVALMRVGRPLEALSDLDYVVQRDPEAPSSTWGNHGGPGPARAPRGGAASPARVPTPPSTRRPSRTSAGVPRPGGRARRAQGLRARAAPDPSGSAARPAPGLPRGAPRVDGLSARGWTRSCSRRRRR
ncbi:MAG: protein kinase [Planctomycetota bacterium]